MIVRPPPIDGNAPDGDGSALHTTATSVHRPNLVDARKDAAQDADFLALEAGTSEQPTQPQQKTPRHLRIEKAHGRERPAAMVVERLDLVVCRRGKAWRAPHVASVRGNAQLVCDDLHRRRQVERRKFRARGNRRHDAAARELVVGKPRHPVSSA
jgi:hypothetical protein